MYVCIYIYRHLLPLYHGAAAALPLRQRRRGVQLLSYINVYVYSCIYMYIYMIYMIYI